jgi:hypothetical protein
MEERKDTYQICVEKYIKACRKVAAKYENDSAPESRIKYAVARAILSSVDSFIPALDWQERYQHTFTIENTLINLAWYIEGTTPAMSQAISETIREINEEYDRQSK